jgi:hypothetical protein
LDAQAAPGKERADRERRLEGWRCNVLTALGERKGAIQEAERRAREASRRMTEGLSVVCEAVENDASDERGRSASRVLGWSTTAMASRYTHVITPIHSDLASRLDDLLWSSRDASIEPN